MGVVDRSVTKVTEKMNQHRMEQTFQIVKEHVESMTILQEKGVLPQKSALQPTKNVELQRDTPTGENPFYSFDRSEGEQAL